MGIIAVAVYREKERPQPPEERQTLRNAPAPESSGRAKSSVQSDESAGTGFGDASYSPVVTVAFEPEGFPIEKMLVKYAWHDVLCRQGILRCQPEPGNRLWDEGAYAPFPPAYRTN